MRHILKNIGFMVLAAIWANPMFAQNSSAHWACDDHAYEYEMAVYFRIIIDDTNISNYENYEVAAFCNTECRGVSEIVALSESNIGYIRIRSNQTSGETISFKAFDKTLNNELDIIETVSFKSEDLLGLPSSPTDFHIYDPSVTPQPSPITITAQNKERTYGDKNPEFTFVAEGDGLVGTPSLSCEATETSPVGNYPIVVSIGTITNENVTLVNGLLTITRAPLTIGVGEYSKEQGEDNPNFVFTYEGFKNGEDESVLTTKPTAVCNATKDSEPGEYEITISGASADNYDISYRFGKLIVKEESTPLPPEQTFGDKEGEGTVKGYITNDGDGNTSVVITELSEDMLNGNSPIPTEIVGEDGTVYKVHEIAAAAFENLPEGTIIMLPSDVHTDKPVVNVINGDGTCKELNLTNVEKFNATKQLIVDKIVYLRDIPLGTSTVCLPYDVDVPVGEVSFYTLTSGIDGNAVFEKYIDKLQAYIPYVMRTEKAMSRGTRAEDESTIQIDFSTKNVVINPNAEDQFVEKDELEMFGTVHGLTNKEGIEKQALILHSDGTWRMSASQAASDSDKPYLPAFNAYMVVKKGIADENQNIGSNFSDVTAIRSIVYSEGEVWYNIHGIRLNGKPTKPGLYIRNGEKVIF